MNHIRRAMSRNERLISLSRPHWIYVVEGVIWFWIITVIGLILDHYLYLYFGSHLYKFEIDLWFVVFNEKYTPIPWVFAFTGFAVFWPLFLIYISHEIGLTDQRIIHKKGFLFIEIDQVDLEDIRAEHVQHGLFGWLLGYGRIRLNCRFIEDVVLPAIRKPYNLVKASHTARMKHPSIEYDHDDFQTNVENIETKRREALAKEKLKNIKEKIKANFRKAA